MFNIGLITGRFYPFHKGHHYLIQQALNNSKEVFIIVVQRDAQTVCGEARAKWIRERFPEENLFISVFDHSKSGIPNKDSRAWSEMVVDEIGFKPDAVFTSESYQNDFASKLGAELILVDPSREIIPISGTAIRENPHKQRHMLDLNVYEDIKNLSLEEDNRD